jgi:HEPN domain-containing protein
VEKAATVTDETHLKYDRTSTREALFRAEQCAQAIVAHLTGLIETRQIHHLRKLARELHEHIKAERRRYAK